MKKRKACQAAQDALNMDIKKPSCHRSKIKGWFLIGYLQQPHLLFMPKDGYYLFNAELAEQPVQRLCLIR